MQHALASLHEHFALLADDQPHELHAHWQALNDPAWPGPIATAQQALEALVAPLAAWYGQQPEACIAGLQRLLPALEAVLDAQPHEADLLDAYVEAVQLSLGFFAPDSEDFPEWELYEALLQRTRGETALHLLRHAQTLLSLQLAWRNWLALGGDPQRLEAPVRETLERHLTHLDERLEQQLAELKSAGESILALALQRMMTRQVVLAGNPQQCEAAALRLEELAEALQRQPDAPLSAPERGELLVELGTWLARAQQPGLARTRLQQALLLLQQGGPDYELSLAQAEAWLAELG